MRVWPGTQNYAEKYLPDYKSKTVTRVEEYWHGRWLSALVFQTAFNLPLDFEGALEGSVFEKSGEKSLHQRRSACPLLKMSISL